jgi:transcriptional regulator GlxA family with amidase domain
MDAFPSSTASFENPSTTPTRQRRSQVVQRASAFLRDHAAESVRIAYLSQVAGVSERALRSAFRREHGVSPKQFDIRERLNQARHALCEGAGADSVTAIATRFGFFELGRFARLYKSAFGESPSHTLRRFSRPEPEVVPVRS